MSFGFIITRHVNSEQTNKYWNHNVKLIRTFYPFKKIIITFFKLTPKERIGIESTIAKI